MTAGEPPSDGNSAGESTPLSLLAAVAVVDLAVDVVVGTIGRSERRFLVGRLLMS